MAVRSGVMQNLINGVSTQPPEVRLPTQVESQVNGYSTLTRGLIKRPPTLQKAILPGWPTTGVRYHTINRDRDERYKVAITATGIRVTDFDGNEKTVNAPEGYGYLADVVNPEEDLDVLTVADHTFILNKRKVVQKAATTSPERLPEALIHVPAALYHKDYEVKINGTPVAKCKTPGGPYGEAGVARKAERATTTGRITKYLLDGSVDDPDEPVDFSGYLTGAIEGPYGTTKNLSGTLDPDEWRISRYNNVIHVENLLGNDFSIEVYVEGETESFRAHKGIVRNFADLPNHGPAGFVIGVSGDIETAFDDYWVRLEKDNVNDGTGVWKECPKPGIQIALDATTMPHILVRESDGTFTFKPQTWGERKVGDEETCPWPSFVGKAPSGLLYHADRLGLKHGSTIVLSRTREHNEFFIETVTAQLDTDPIDTEVTVKGFTSIAHAVPYATRLFLFSERKQVALMGDETLTPSSVHVEPLTDYLCDPAVPPVVSGASLMFAVPGYTSSGVREYQFDDQAGVKADASITDHCTGYLPQQFGRFTAIQNMVVATDRTAPDRLFVYKHYTTSDGQRLQSSWSHWDFGDPVLEVEFVRDELVLVIDRGGVVSIESIPCDEAFRDFGKDLIVHLDRRVHSDTLAAPSYDVNTDTTTWTLPYPAEGSTVIVAPPGDSIELPVVGTAGNTVSVNGDYREVPVLIGFPYEMRVRLSQFIAREGGGKDGPGIAFDGELNVGYVVFQTAGTGYFRVEMTRLYRGTHAYEFTGVPLGDPADATGVPTFDGRPFRISVMCPAKEVTLDIVSDSYLPCAFLAATWHGEVYRRFVT